jgi:hypothetical protein
MSWRWLIVAAVITWMGIISILVAFNWPQATGHTP